MHRLLSGLALALTLTLLPAVATASAPTADETVTVSSERPGLVLRNRAWGPLRLRMSVAEAQATGMVSETPSACSAGYDMEPRFAGRGFVLWNEPDGDRDRMLVGGLVIIGAVDRTENGAGVGTTLRRLRDLYPRLTKPTNWAKLHDQHPTRHTTWTVGVRKNGAFLNFQFDFREKPKPSSKVAAVLISRKQDVWMGC